MRIIKSLADSQPEIRQNAIRRLVQIPVGWIFVASVLFIAAGTIKWPNAWLFMVLLVAVDLIGLPFISVEVLAERGSKKENVEKWDEVMGKLIVLSMLLMFVISGLDYRWKLSPDMDSRLHMTAIILFVIGSILVVWAMRANEFFSDVVRIQFDRGHRVCTSGPYKYVRHPGYLGMITYYFATPMILGSWLAMLPAITIVIVFIARTNLEDRTLIKKLAGYMEYADHVRFRLIPGIW